MVCIKLKDKFDPRVGKDLVHGIMNFFAKTVLHWLVRPFILLFFCLTFTASLILLFRVNIGLDQTVALPKVRYFFHLAKKTCGITVNVSEIGGGGGQGSQPEILK